MGCQDAGRRPIPVDPATTPTLTAESVIFPRADVWQAFLDGGLALLDRAAGRVTLLNASAALILTAFDGVQPLHAVVDQLVRETGGDRASIASDAEATVARLVAAGIVDIGAPPAQAPSGDHEAGDPGTRSVSGRVDEERPDEPGPWALLRDVTVGGTTCRLRVEDPSLAEVVGSLVSSLPEASSRGGVHTVSLVTLDQPGSRRYRVVADGGVAADDASRDQAIVQLLHELDDLAATGAGEALTFHAGAVARDGRAVLIAGSSGKGKSTLTAALVQRGWSYLTDEVAAVRLEDHRILPYPKALDLDEGSRKLLRVKRAAVDLGAGKQKVLPTALGRVGDGATPVLVVLLAGTEAQPERGRAPLERLTPSEALLALMPATYVHSIDGPERFQALAALCEQVPVVRMDRARLARCVATVEAEAAPGAHSSLPTDTGS